jgi:Clp amino terminal domain, pathogenicity island component
MAAVPGIDQLRAQIAPGTPLEQLTAASVLAEKLRARGDELLDHFVDAARAGGSSWSEIGCSLGTSKQAAQQRFAALADPPPGQAPFGLTGTSADVLTAAAAQARELGHHYIRPEHLVLGLLARPEELAARVLAELGVTPAVARKRVEERLGTGAPRPTGSLGAAPQTKRLLELARAIARSLGHRCARTEHILLAASSPKLHSPAAALLVECDTSPDRVRDQVTRMLLREAPDLADRLRNRSLLSRVRMRSL